VTGTATFEDWLAKYQEVYASPAVLQSLSCPNCGFRDLRLVLVLQRQGDQQGWAAFWCEHCMTGVALDLAEVRPGMPTFVADEDPKSIRTVIPNYRLTKLPPTRLAEGVSL
jgi:hypothetical protein